MQPRCWQWRSWPDPQLRAEILDQTTSVGAVAFLLQLDLEQRPRVTDLWSEPRSPGLLPRSEPPVHLHQIVLSRGRSSATLDPLASSLVGSFQFGRMK